MFDFTGNCEYILAKGYMSDTDSFTITVKNVPCGTTSVTCSKAITINIGTGAEKEIVNLVNGKETVLGNSIKRLIKSF